MPVAPAVGKPLAETGAPDLPAQLGPEAVTSLAGASGDRAFDVAQLGLHVCLERAGDAGGKLQVSSSSCHWLGAAFGGKRRWSSTPRCPLLTPLRT
jgi:hypothetical protein